MVCGLWNVRGRSTFPSLELSMFHLEAWKDGSGAHAESEHVGDRGDSDGDSGVLVDISTDPI